jgi:uncharacterized protein YjbI with pentapeptide repeats
MADPAHVQLLNDGPEALRSWRAANPGVILDLSGAELPNSAIDEGVPLEGANLTQTQLVNSSLKHANFTQANLFGANFTNSDLEGAILCQANLTYTNLSSANLGQADLTGARCENANFASVDLRTIKYEGATFRGASFHTASLPHRLLLKTDCVGAKFPLTDLSGADLSGRDFSSCVFHNAKLAGTYFRGATLKSATFHECDLQGADMSYTECDGANFYSAKLMRACLRHASLKGANFTSANFEEADVSHADFYETILDSASMRCLKGAPHAKNLSTTRASQPVQYFETAILTPVDGWMDWERVRIFGRLPLFGASYSMLVAIPFFFYALELYNDKVALLRTWAEDKALSSGMAHTLLQHLEKLPPPDLSKVLLLSTLALAVGATIYALWCPSRIKEFSRDQWKYQLQLPVIHYLADAWRRRPLRVAALAFYIVGGMGALGVLGSKLVNVAEFLLKNQ